MSRTRYRYDTKLEKLVVIEDRPRPQAGPFYMDDIKPFVSPIDGSEITSRSKLRAHERTHGVRQAGDFKSGELISQEKRRVEQSQPKERVDFKWY